MQQININELKPHPRNNEFFDDMSGDKWEEFLASIRSRGVIEPIVITPDKMIVSGHQRVRACKELGITTIMCDVHTYNNEDQILQDLLETNIRQRGDIGGSAKKIGLRLDELKRLYNIKHGNNQHASTPNNSGSTITQKQLASMNNMSVDTMENYIILSKMIPELNELVDTGIVTKTTALAIIRNLSEKEQEELISSMNTTKRITQKQVQQYIEKIKELESRKPEVVDNTDYSSISQLENRIKNLENEKSILEKKVKLNQEDSDKFNKLKSDIDFLINQKSDLSRQINSATELAGLTVRLQKLLEEDLAPIKFKRCIDVLESSNVAIKNLSDIIDKIDNWSQEMKNILGKKYDDIVSVQ